MKVLYLCDKRQDGCKATSCGSDCHHTLDIRHAKNFELGLDGITMIEKTNPLVIFEAKGLIPSRVLQQIREALVEQVAEGVVICDGIVKPVAITGFDGVIYDISIAERGEKARDEFKPIYLNKPYSSWIPVNKDLPKEGQEVLVTIETDNSYGKGTKIKYEVDLAEFHKETGYIKSANGNGFFNTDNDWDEGQPIQVIAWMSKPGAYSIKRSDA